MNEKYYVLNLWDYGAPAFVSFDKMYIGTEADIRDAMRSMKKKNADSETVIVMVYRLKNTVCLVIFISVRLNCLMLRTSLIRDRR